MIKRTVIYDFDGTLFKSPTREEAEKNKSGKFPFQSWWDREESLLPPIVPAKPTSEMFFDRIIEFQKNDAKEENTEVILMTGRPIKLKSRVMEICDCMNLKFDRTFFSGQIGSKGKNTFEIKTNFIEEKILKNQEVLEIYEDRPEHIKKFCEKAREWISEKKLEQVVIHDVKKLASQIFM